MRDTSFVPPSGVSAVVCAVLGQKPPVLGRTLSSRTEETSAHSFSRASSSSFLDDLISLLVGEKQLKV